MDTQKEHRLGAFILDEGECHTGSQGAVYHAVCDGEFPGVAIGESVALKTIPASDDPEAFSRLESRVRELSAIIDDHVVRYRGCFMSVGPFQSLHVVVMDWLEGKTLKDRLASDAGGLDADEALRIADKILAGVEACHKAGLVHRDIKPGNVFLCADGDVRLIDFELAHQAGSTAKSMAGSFTGTFDYMAPEFVDTNFRGSPQSDVFAVGVVVHEMLTGHPPYSRKTQEGERADFAFLSRWSQRKEGLCGIKIKSSVRRVLSHADEVLLKALAENAADRYPDATSFRAGLRQIRYREVRSMKDSYRLLRFVGEGGFGCVYKARARGTGNLVAIKQLKRAEFGDRFRREAHVMQRLDDSAFVRFVDYFETHDVGIVGAFLVMDFLPGMPGSSLRDAIRRAEGTPVPFNDAVAAFERYARALSVMHRQNIFHRDIKPSNLYFPTYDLSRAAIMDLGIARDVSGTATQGQVPGTLDYMPPEVVLGGSRGDAGMDIYALGLCLYEAITARTAYPRLPTGPAAFSAFYERARSKQKPVFDAPILNDHPLMLALLKDMTALDPAERLQDAEVVRRRLMAAAAESPNAAKAKDDSPEEGMTVMTSCATVGTVFAPEALAKQMAPRRRFPWAAVAGVAVVALGLVAALAFFKSRRAEVEEDFGLPQPEVAAVEPVAPARVPEVPTSPEPAPVIAETPVVAEVPAVAEMPAVAESVAQIVTNAEPKNVAVEVAKVAVTKMTDAEPLKVTSVEPPKVTASVPEPPKVTASAPEPPKVTAIEPPKPKPVVSEPPKVSAPVASAKIAPDLPKPSAPKKSVAESPAMAALAALDKRKVVEDVRAKVIVPVYPKEIRCFVDDVERQPGTIQMSHGTHTAKYCRREETYKGVPDYLPKVIPFKAELSTVNTIPLPTGEWVHSKDYDSARQNADLANRGHKIEAECRRLIVPLPIENRRERLDKAHALLSDWHTAPALAAIGIDAEKRLRADYEAERARIRGYVRNRTPHDMTVNVWEKPVKVPAGETALLLSEKWPSDPHAEFVGFENVILPRDAMLFDGNTFTILPDKLIPLVVKVTRPPLETGVRCRVDGKDMQESVKLLPGAHEVVYSKDGYIDQKLPFTVELATARTLPQPNNWEPLTFVTGTSAAARSVKDAFISAGDWISDSFGKMKESMKAKDPDNFDSAINVREDGEGTIKGLH